MDGFRGGQEAPSRQPDAPKTLLHTFHPPTVWPWHELRGWGGVLLCAGSQFYLKWHWICSWLTSWAFIMASTESQNALPVSYLGSFSQPLLNLFGGHLSGRSNWILSVPSAWSKGFVSLAHNYRWLFIINLVSEVCLDLGHRSNSLIIVSPFQSMLGQGRRTNLPKRRAENTMLESSIFFTLLDLQQGSVCWNRKLVSQWIQGRFSQIFSFAFTLFVNQHLYIGWAGGLISVLSCVFQQYKYISLNKKKFDNI